MADITNLSHLAPFLKPVLKNPATQSIVEAPAPPPGPARSDDHNDGNGGCLYRGAHPSSRSAPRAPQGILPGLAVFLLTKMVPEAMRTIAESEGIETKSGLDSAQMTKMFLFNTVNVFGANIIAGSVISALRDLLRQPSAAVDQFATAIPGTARFFMTLVVIAVRRPPAQEPGHPRAQRARAELAALPRWRGPEAGGCGAARRRSWAPRTW